MSEPERADPHDVHYFESAFKELEVAAPRARAILGGCLIDDQMKRLIQGYAMQRCDCVADAYDSIFNDGSHLLAGSSMNYWAHCLGLYGQQTYTNIKIIHWIRNKFAHWAVDRAAPENPLTFDTPMIANEVSRLDFLDHWYHYTSWREEMTNNLKFVNTALGVAGGLMKMRKDMTRPSRYTNLP